MKLQRIHYNVDNFTVSDEVLTIDEDSVIGTIFANNTKIVRVAFLRDDGEEIVWRTTT